MIGTGILAGFLFSCSPTTEYLKKQNIRITGELRDIRVLLLKTSGTVTVSSDSRTRVTEISSGHVVFDASDSAMVITPAKIKDPVSVISMDSILTVNGTPYRGSLEIHNILGVLNVINIVSMNDYLKGVVPAEMPVSWPMEALKAQAVAARTFCYSRLGSGDRALYNLDSTTRSQVYRGRAVENVNSSRAVDDTDGIIITCDERPVVAYFHSTCGGRTADGEDVWPGTCVPYLKSRECGWCRESSHYSWETELSAEEIEKAVRTKYRGVKKISGVAFSRHRGRVTEVKITYENGSIKLNGNEFRLMFSPMTVKSLYFSSAKKGKKIVLTGHGWGHGAGMCQWGARGMALDGKNFSQILSAYYTGIKLVKISQIRK